MNGLSSVGPCINENSRSLKELCSTSSRAFFRSAALRNMLIVIFAESSPIFLSPSRQFSFISSLSNPASLHLRFRHLLALPRPRVALPLSRGRRERKRLCRTRSGCPRILYSHTIPCQAGRQADPQTAHQEVQTCNDATTGSSKGPCPAAFEICSRLLVSFICFFVFCVLPRDSGPAARSKPCGRPAKR